jgi:hypothetical protein
MTLKTYKSRTIGAKDKQERKRNKQEEEYIKPYKDWLYKDSEKKLKQEREKRSKE